MQIRLISSSSSHVHQAEQPLTLETELLEEQIKPSRRSEAEVDQTFVNDCISSTTVQVYRPDQFDFSIELFCFLSVSPLKWRTVEGCTRVILNVERLICQAG